MRYLVFCLLSSLLLAGLVPQAMAGEEIRRGTVVSTSGAEKYTYIEVDEQGKTVWLAAKHMEVAVGDVIEFAGGVPMTDFYSKELKKTFEDLLMVTRIRRASSLSEKGDTAMPNDDLHRGILQSEPTASPAAEPVKGEVVRKEGEISIAELFKQRADLSGQKVTVRGRVIKISEKILGKTWLTLSDGTGTAPDNVLRVTTTGTAAIGQIRSARGTVKTDVDLGSGYRYKLLIEEAELGD